MQPATLRLLLASQPKLVTPVLQVVRHAITRFLLDQAGLKAEHAGSGAVTLIQRFGCAANLNTHMHCLVLDGVYRRTDGEPVFVEVAAPTDEALQALLHKIIGRLTAGRAGWPSTRPMAHAWRDRADAVALAIAPRVERRFVQRRAGKNQEHSDSDGATKCTRGVRIVSIRR